jgi:hypothetical protein
MKWATPFVSALSCREPVVTHIPIETEWAWGIFSVITRIPLLSSDLVTIV